MKFLSSVMRYFGLFQFKKTSESQNFGAEAPSHDGARIAAIAVALHHHDLENSDVRSKVAAIAAALHHHEMENSPNGSLLGIAALVAAIHHRNKIQK